MSRFNPTVEIGDASLDQESRNLTIQFYVNGGDTDKPYWLQPSLVPEDSGSGAYAQDRYYAGIAPMGGTVTHEATFDMTGADSGEEFYVEAFLAELLVGLDEFNKTDPNGDNYSYIENPSEIFTIEYDIDPDKVYTNSCSMAGGDVEPGETDTLQVSVRNDNPAHIYTQVVAQADSEDIGFSDGFTVSPNGGEETVDVPVSYPTNEGQYDVNVDVLDVWDV